MACTKASELSRMQGASVGSLAKMAASMAKTGLKSTMRQPPRMTKGVARVPSSPDDEWARGGLGNMEIGIGFRLPRGASASTALFRAFKVPRGNLVGSMAASSSAPA